MQEAVELYPDIHVALHPLKAAFIPKTKTLILSDLHVGKSRHFLQSGIPLPPLTSKVNYWNIVQLFEEFQPAHWVVLGDLIHSDENSEWDEFEDFLETLPPIRKTLVMGNHDQPLRNRLSPFGFACTEELVEGSILFTHEKTTPAPKDHFQITGHVHPAITLQGKANQRMRIPCFWLSGSHLTLPAFGSFTGAYTIHPHKKDRVFACIESEVIEFKP